LQPAAAAVFAVIKVAQKPACFYIGSGTAGAFVYGNCTSQRWAKPLFEWGRMGVQVAQNGFELGWPD
jgi:hypothetical protein